MNEIMVSVLCTAYNHEKYIRQCLDSILCQKTNFKYEVLVHDDASTDNTAEIIREFQNEYPDVVIPVIQNKNQYSQGIHINSTFLLPLARGKYIAMCEGDDYWIDVNKLQIQVDLMEQHPEIDMCTHGAVKVKNGKTVGYVTPDDTQTVYTPDEIIRGGGNMFATNSILYRINMRGHTPRFIQCFEFDYSLQVWGSLHGGILYTPQVMSAYRLMADNSWSKKMKENTRAYIEHLRRVEEMETILAEEIDEKYRLTVEEDLINIRISILRLERNFRELKKPEYKNVIRRYSIKKKMKLAIKTILRRM